MKRILALAFLLIISKTSFSQKQNNVWYFGYYTAVSFNSGEPVALTNNPYYTAEGSASISDNNGNFLFYTNGVSVWNRNLVKMPNGTGLKGNNSTTQSALIVPEPGNCNIYYIFTAPAQSDTIPLCYNIVDMTLDGGLGDITSKNIPLFTPVTERLTGTLKSNGIDYWVVGQQYNSNGFLAFSVTSSGVNTTPVISYSGPLIDSTNGGLFDVLGYMKISPDGSKLCYANLYGNGPSQLFDFNNITGQVSNNIPLADSSDYGVEFSPDKSKVYIQTLNAPYIITQYDLSAGSPTAIQNSATQIVYELFNHDSTIIEHGGALELGPDNKIYSCRLHKNFLSVINNPNLLGPLCNFVDTGVILTNQCTDGLPNNIKVLTSSTTPVTLLNFTSTLLNKAVQLQWQTATEINSNYFLIERSANGTTFTTIGKQSAAGNSSSLKQHTFTDNAPLNTNYYRLKEVDLNGNSSYSNVLLVNLPQANTLTILQNPVQTSLQVQVNSGAPTPSPLTIFDLSGRKLKTLSLPNGLQTIDVSALPAGVYILQLITSNGYSYNQRFVKGK